MFIIICLSSQYPPLLWEQYSLFSGRDSSKEKHRCRLSFILLFVFYFCPGITLKETFVSLDRALGCAQGWRREHSAVSAYYHNPLLFCAQSPYYNFERAVLSFQQRLSRASGSRLVLTHQSPALYRRMHAGPNSVSSYDHVSQEKRY